METAEQIKGRILARFPESEVSVVSNPSPSGQHSLLLGRGAFEAARFLKEEPSLRFDLCSNVTGIDWPGWLEVVYHLYSIELRQGPVILRMRTTDRAAQNSVPSLTPIWRSCEFQEREVFDLFGVRFEGHPDLRRILMWDELTDHPMRKDYAEADDYEWEPTAHGEILAKAKRHYPPDPQ